MINFEYTLIPLGIIRQSTEDGNRLSFPLHIISRLKFGSHVSNAEIEHAISNSILNKESEVKVEIKTSGAGLGFEAKLVPDMFRDAQGNPFDTSSNLMDFLDVNPKLRALKSYEEGQPVFAIEHDDRFDSKTADDIVDASDLYGFSVARRDYMASFVSNIVWKTMLTSSSKSPPLSEQYDGRLFKLINRIVTEYILEGEPIFEQPDSSERNKYLAQSKALASKADENFGYFLSQLITDNLFDQGHTINSLIEKQSDEWKLRAAGPGDRYEKWQKLFERLTGFKNNSAKLANASISKVIPEQELSKQVKRKDPNILIQSALKEPVFSKYLGLHTKWRVVLPKSKEKYLKPGNEFEIQVNGCKKMDDTPRYLGDCFTLPTVFHIHEGGHIAPATKPVGVKNPVKAKHHGLVWLKEGDQKRYKTVQVNVEHELIKGVVLQASNTVQSEANKPAHDAFASNNKLITYDPDELESSDNVARNREELLKDSEKPADLLGEDSFGINQPTTSGLAFCAPPEDIVCQSCDPSAVEDKYYYEDLWVGYRVDISEDDSYGTPYRSIHEQIVDIEYKYGAEDSKLPGVYGIESESVIDKEQLQMEREQGIEFAVWNGIGNAQKNPAAQSQIGGKIKRVRDKKNGLIKYDDLGKNPNPDQLEEVDFLDLSPFEKRARAKPNSLPRLQYCQSGNFRIRATFPCGISLPKEDADEIQNLENNSRYECDYSFKQVESYSPGELVKPDLTGSIDSNSNDNTVYLLDKGAETTVYICPRPIEFDEARYRGVIGNTKEELERYKNVPFTKNLRKLLVRKNKLNWKKYFLDPDVSRLQFNAKSLARNPDIPSTFEINQPKNAEEIAGALCSVVDHWNFGNTELSYGKLGDWEKYQPIAIRVCSKDIGSPRATNRNRNLYQLEVSEGDVVDLSIIPKITESQKFNNAIFQNIKTHSEKIGDKTGFIDSTPPFPPIISERKLKVVHATRKPLSSPVLKVEPKQLLREAENRSDMDDTYYMDKSKTGNSGFVKGMVFVDAKTTGTIRFRAKWEDPLDNPNQTEYIFTSSSINTPPRNVLFKEKPLPPQKRIGSMAKEEFSAQVLQTIGSFNRQCVEDLVVLGGNSDSKNPSQNESTKQNNEITFGDGKRRLVDIEVIGKSRYRKLYSDEDETLFESVSDIVKFDVPSSIRPSAPRISHILPTFKRYKRIDQDDRTHIGEEIGLRIYLDRPFFEDTGIGERLAIACAYKENDTPEVYAKLKKYATMWGEDPLERPKLKTTLRMPKSSDFVSPEMSDSEFPIDARLYPGTNPAEQNDIIYSTVNHPIAPLEDADGVLSGQNLPLNLASYAVRYDKDQSLWFCDVLVKGNFFGWLGMALYKYQPHSENDAVALSENPVFSYATILHGDTIVYSRRDNWLNITVGPVYDKTITYKISEVSEYSDEITQLDKSNESELEKLETNFHISIELNQGKRIAIKKYKKNILLGVVSTI